MINQQVKVGVANNDKRAKCWCGTGKVGVATATPAIRHSPPMPASLYTKYKSTTCIPCRKLIKVVIRRSMYITSLMYPTDDDSDEGEFI